MTNTIVKGSAVRLLESHEHLPAGTVGLVNTVVNVDKKYVWFMPSTEFQIYILDAERFELIPDDEAQAIGFEELIPEIPEDLQDVLTRDKDDILAFTAE
ncbi:conserved hypothetical protein [Vibrio phage 177E37-1]|nr:conserved hypothetical protein [Vibrio phage 177E37-1]